MSSPLLVDGSSSWYVIHNDSRPVIRFLLSLQLLVGCRSCSAFSPLKLHSSSRSYTILMEPERKNAHLAGGEDCGKIGKKVGLEVPL